MEDDDAQGDLRSSGANQGWYVRGSVACARLGQAHTATYGSMPSFYPRGVIISSPPHSLMTDDLHSDADCSSSAGRSAAATPSRRLARGCRVVNKS